MTAKSSRREFLTRSAQGIALAATGGLVWSYLLQQQAQAAPHAIRPPGAHDEVDFNAKCIKCGQCVRDCPYDTLKLAPAGDSVAIGTPYFSALDPSLEVIEDSRMGLAVIDIENCLSWQGLRCEICHRECPVQNKAITVEHHPRKISKHAMFVPLVHSDACTGCGVCEKACPTEVAAIRVVQPELVQGKIGEHYRLGWTIDTPITQDFKPQQRVDEQPAPATGLDYLNQGDL
jgi:ferredoxin-type protein NapG